jgi:D-glycero-D-manno-heptose 1,7-bisphosphate phosphatase
MKSKREKTWMRDQPRRAVFLDRDGTLNEDSPAYIKTEVELHIYPETPVALARLHAAGFALVLVTNQSAIGRRLTTAAEVERIHDRLRAVLGAQGVPILDIMICPHLPEDGCPCRKPLPGMIEEACARHAIDALRSFMIGDKESDIEAGARAGCRTALIARGPQLVAPGRANHVCRDLSAAAEWITRTAPPIA